MKKKIGEKKKLMRKKNEKQRIEKRNEKKKTFKVYPMTKSG